MNVAAFPAPRSHFPARGGRRRMPACDVSIIGRAWRWTGFRRLNPGETKPACYGRDTCWKRYLRGWQSTVTIAVTGSIQSSLSTYTLSPFVMQKVASRLKCPPRWRKAMRDTGGRMHLRRLNAMRTRTSRQRAPTDKREGLSRDNFLTYSSLLFPDNKSRNQWESHP